MLCLRYATWSVLEIGIPMYDFLRATDSGLHSQSYQTEGSYSRITERYYFYLHEFSYLPTANTFVLD